MDVRANTVYLYFIETMMVFRKKNLRKTATHFSKTKLKKLNSNIYHFSLACKLHARENRSPGNFQICLRSAEFVTPPQYQEKKIILPVS
jgi:hypothetical protein